MGAYASQLLAWYRRHGRDLPWRRTRDPYALFMSELMLQQTQVDRVIGFWDAWCKRFPNWNALADAPTPDLLHAWAGLGYNRRALFAREAARQVVANGVPDTEDSWRHLKGVGPYMAAALTAFVDRQRAIVVDTNIRRVAGRALLGIAHPRPADDARIKSVLERETPVRGAHFDLPQAEMDIANAVCHVRSPDCAACPLKDACLAHPLFANGPVERPRAKKTERIREGKRWPDRIYRGRILAWIRAHGPTPIAHLGAKADETYRPTDQEWVEAMVGRLAADGMVEVDEKRNVRLPRA